MKYCVNKEECIGCGLCTELAPDMFVIKDDTAEAIKENDEKAEEAYNSCPVSAIKKED